MRCNTQHELNTEQIRTRNEEMFSYSIFITKSLLKIVGAWPLEADASILEKFFKYLLNVIYYFLFIFFLVPNVLYIILIPRSILIKLRVASTGFACFGNAIKYILLMKRSKELEMLFDNTKRDWQILRLDEDYECMKANGKYGRGIAILSTCMIYSGTIFSRVMMPLVKGKVIVNNITIRPLAIPGYYVIFDEQKSPAYELVFLGHLFSGLAGYTVASAVLGITTFFVLHTCAQLEILIRKMKDVEMVNSGDGDAKEQVTDIVLHQMKIRSFIKKIINLMEYMILMEIATCMFLICSILYCLIMEYDSAVSASTYIIALISFTYDLFIFCYVGELLADQQMKVIATSNTLDCHHLSTKSARSLILIILISNSTSKLTAGKILDLSLRSFASIFKTTIGYFNILRSVTY